MPTAIEMNELQTKLDANIGAFASLAGDRATAYRQRFRFSLAIGNAAGLVYVLTMITADTPVLPWWHVLPSAWAFVGGTVAGTVMLFVASLASETTSNRWRTHLLSDVAGRLDRIRDGLVAGGVELEEVTATNNDATLETDLAKWAKRYGIAALVLEVAAALAFVVGVLFPLIILTARAWA